MKAEAPIKKQTKGLDTRQIGGTRKDFLVSKVRLSKDNKRYTTFLIRFIDDAIIEKLLAYLIEKDPDMYSGSNGMERLNEGFADVVSDYNQTVEDDDQKIRVFLNHTIKQFREFNSTKNTEEDGYIHPVLNMYNSTYDGVKHTETDGIEKTNNTNLEGIFVGKNLFSFSFNEKSPDFNFLVTQANNLKETLDDYKQVLLKNGQFSDLIKLVADTNILISGHLRTTAYAYTAGTSYTIPADIIQKIDLHKAGVNERIYVDNNARSEESAWEKFHSTLEAFLEIENQGKNNTETSAYLSISRAYYQKIEPLLKSKQIKRMVKSIKLQNYSVNNVISLAKSLNKEGIVFDDLSETEILERLNTKPSKMSKKYNLDLAKKVFVQKNTNALEAALAKIDVNEEDIDSFKKLQKFLENVFLNEI